MAKAAVVISGRYARRLDPVCDMGRSEAAPPAAGLADTPGAAERRRPI